MAIAGLLLYGTTAFLTSEDGIAVSREPVYLTASMIDAAIADGTLEAGAFNNVTVQPPACEWPERWRHLKELEWLSQTLSTVPAQPGSFPIR
jgi:hypothetical protein